MRQAIRALGWATKLFWIILIVLAITIGYSATLINISLGEVQTTTTDQTVTISFPIAIQNNGFYDIAQLNVTTYITDENSHTLAQGTTLTRLIQRGTQETHTHSMTIDIAQILAQGARFLFNDATFTMFQHVSLNYAGIIPFEVAANQTMPWGAPLSNLAIGQVTYRPYNITHSVADVQLTFENHNQYIPVTGTVRAEIYNTNQSLLGQGTGNVDAPPNTFYDGTISVFVRNSILTPTPTPSSEVHLFFETPVFSYGPVVIPFG